MADFVRVAKGDPACGENGAEGEIVKWPETDVMGRPYDKRNAIRLGSGDNKLFVVVPTDFSAQVVFGHESPKAAVKVESK